MSDQQPATSAVRHMTATGFLVWEARVLLHWHRKNRLWLPFGGHIEENEDPVQTVLREIEEECGVAAELLPGGRRYPFAEPRQIAAPVTILLERATDGQQWHEHIDLIYFCRPRAGIAALATASDPTLHWLSAAELEANAPISPLPGEPPAAVPLDVRVLALEAIAAARGLTYPPNPLPCAGRGFVFVHSRSVISMFAVVVGLARLFLHRTWPSSPFPRREGG